MNVSSRHYNSKFDHSFDFHCLANFAKKYQFVLYGFFSVWFLWKFSIYTLKIINVWQYGEQNLLLIFIYSNSKFKVTCKNADIECPYIRTQTKEKPSINFQHYIRHFTFPSQKCFNLIAILSTLESTSLDETIRCVSKWFIQTQRRQKLEFVNFKCITYAQLIPLPLEMLLYVHFIILLLRQDSLKEKAFSMVLEVFEMYQFHEK